jgi:hypothetical protein
MLGFKVFAALEIPVRVAASADESSRLLVHFVHVVELGGDRLSVGPKQAADVPTHASHANLRRTPIVAEVHVAFLPEPHLAALVAGQRVVAHDIFALEEAGRIPDEDRMAVAVTLAISA